MMEPKFFITEKKCPICQTFKSVDEFAHYFSKPRQKVRIQSYCKICQKPAAIERSRKYYEDHKDERLIYQSNYSKNPANKIKINTSHRNRKRIYRQVLKDCYVRDLLVQKKFKNKDLIENPELVQFFKTKLKLKRKLKKIQNGK